MPNFWNSSKNSLFHVRAVYLSPYNDVFNFMTAFSFRRHHTYICGGQNIKSVPVCRYGSHCQNLNVWILLILMYTLTFLSWLLWNMLQENTFFIQAISLTIAADHSGFVVHELSLVVSIAAQHKFWVQIFLIFRVIHNCPALHVIENLHLFLYFSIPSDWHYSSESLFRQRFLIGTLTRTKFDCKPCRLLSLTARILTPWLGAVILFCILLRNIWIFSM